MNKVTSSTRKEIIITLRRMDNPNSLKSHQRILAPGKVIEHYDVILSDVEMEQSPSVPCVEDRQ